MLTLVLSIAITEPAMIYREFRQSKKGGFPLETDDLIRYTITIVIAELFHIALINLLFL